MQHVLVSQRQGTSHAQVIAELRSLLEGVTVEKRALQSSAARESTQHNRSAPGSPLASPPPSPVRQSLEALPSPSPPPQPQQLQPADSLAQLLRGSMLDRPRASGFTIPILGSDAGDDSRTSSDAALPADAVSGGLPNEGGPAAEDSAAVASKVLRSGSGAASSKGPQQLQPRAADTSIGRLAQRGLGAADVAGPQRPGVAWRGADGPAKNAAAPRALAGGARSAAVPTEQPATPSNEGREQSLLRTGIVTSATSSLEEAAALDSIAALQQASVARAHQSAQHPGRVSPSLRTPGAHLSGRLSPPIGSRGVAAGMTVRPGLTWADEPAHPRREAANLGAALGPHEGDWGSAWGAGLTVLPSGASVSDAADASPVSSVDLLAPRPSCIVDVAADPIVPPSPPPASSAIDRLLRTALQASVPEEEPIEGGAPAALGGNLTTRSALAGQTAAGHLPVTTRHQEPGQQPRGRRKLVTRSAQEVSSSDLQQALDQSTARSSAPVGLAAWRQVVPTSVFALSEDGQAAESAALATRWGPFAVHAPLGW